MTPPVNRRTVENAIEALIALLDEWDGDWDLEDEPADGDDDYEAEEAVI